MKKTKDSPDPLLEAELEVQESNEQIVHALNHLRDKVENEVRSLEKFIQLLKKPLALSAIALLVGISVGQMIRLMLFKDKPRSF